MIFAVFVCIILLYSSASFASPTFVYDGFSETAKKQFIQFYNDVSPYIENILGTAAKRNGTVTLHYIESELIGWDGTLSNLYIPPASDGSLDYVFLTIELSMLWMPRVDTGFDPMLYRPNEYSAHAITALVATNMKKNGFLYFDTFTGDMYHMKRKIEIADNPTGDGSFREALDTIGAHNVFQTENNYDINGFCCDVGSILHMTLYKLDNNYFKNFINKWISNTPWATQSKLLEDIISSCSASKVDGIKTVEEWVKEDPIFNRIYDTRDIGIDIVATKSGRVDISTELNSGPNNFCILGFSDKKSYLNPPGIPVYDIRKDEDFFNKPVNVTISSIHDGTKKILNKYIWNTKSDLDNEMEHLDLAAGTYKIEASMNIYDTVISDELIITVKSLTPTVAPTVPGGGSGGGGCNMNYNLLSVFLVALPVFLIRLK